MKIFCINNDSSILPPAVNINQITAILNIHSQLRTNQDHNIIYMYFKQNKFFNKFEKLNGTIKTLMSIREIMYKNFQKGEKPLNFLKDFKFVQLLRGSLYLKKQDEKIKFNAGTILEKKLLEDSTDIIIRQPCEFAILSQQKYQQILKFNEKVQIRPVVEQLRKYPILSNLNYIHLVYLVFNSSKQSYVPKQTIYNENQSPQYWYAIIKGQFQLIKRQKKQIIARSLEKTQNLKIKKKIDKNIQLVILQEKQSFGEEEIILDCKRQYSVICRSIENQLMKIPAKDIRAVLQHYPIILQNLKNKILLKKNWKVQLQKSIEIVKDNYKNQKDKIYNASLDNHYYENQIQNLKTENGTQTIKSNLSKKNILNTLNKKLIKNSGQFDNQTSRRMSKLSEYDVAKISPSKPNSHLSILSQKNILKLPKLEHANYNLSFENQHSKSKVIRRLTEDNINPIDATDYVKQKQQILTKILNKSEPTNGIMPIQLQRRQLIQLQRPQRNHYHRKITTSKQYIQQILQGVFKGSSTTKVIPIKRGIENSFKKFHKNNSQEFTIIQNNPFDKAFFNQM